MAKVISIISWSLSLGNKFYRVVPVLTFVIVFLTLIAQVTSLLSFFLPLKILILLGSEGMPHYFPASFSNLGRDTLIGLLCLATVGIYLMSILADKLVEYSTNKAVNKLLEKSHKIALFENQSQIAANGYRGYSSALAGGVFIPLALLALGYFFPSMAAVIAGYMLLVGLLLVSLYQLIGGVGHYLEKKLRVVLGVAGNIGFFLVFAFLVVEFLFLSPPSFMVAIISLIASRQIFGRAIAAINSISALAKQRSKLDALFFHGKVFHTADANRDKKDLFWILRPEERRKWIFTVLEEADIEDLSSRRLETVWFESSQPNIPHILIYDSKTGDAHYLVKLFGANRRSLAQHEASLATERSRYLPIPELVLLTEVDRFPCHVYKLPPGDILDAKSLNSKIAQLNAQLFIVDLSDALRNRFVRSRPMLGERLSVSLIEHLHVACRDCKDQLLVAELLDRLTEIQSVLQKLPVVLVNPGVRTCVWEARDGLLLVLNWEKWSLEPIGSSWPVGKKNMGALSKYLSSAIRENNRLSNVPLEGAQLAALIFELERLIKKQQLMAALDLLPGIFSKLNLYRKN